MAYNSLNEENDKLKSQLLVAHKEIKTLQAESEKTIKIYRELEDKEKHEV